MASEHAALIDHLRFFADLGVAGAARRPEWRERGGGPEKPGAPEQSESREGPQPPASGGAAGMPADHASLHAADATMVDQGKALDAIRTDIGDCTRCKLHQLGRRQIVFGVGAANADLMFVGEAPGYDEDVQGAPFVGRAGQLLTRIIEAIDLTRDDVYIANVIKCRPPDNRNPEPDEIETCSPFLLRQIEVVNPRVIVALGSFAARLLLQTDLPISRLRGRFARLGEIPLMPTFHPSYLLRNPAAKREVWEDMKLVRALLRGEDQ